MPLYFVTETCVEITRVLATKGILATFTVVGKCEVMIVLLDKIENEPLKIKKNKKNILGQLTHGHLIPS